VFGVLAQVFLSALEALGLAAAGLVDRPAGGILVGGRTATHTAGLVGGGLRFARGPQILGLSLVRGNHLLPACPALADVLL
jgi:hypothetical protein